MKGRKVKDKQAAFVREYLIDLYAASATRRAGYSPKTATTIGHQPSNRPHITEAIREGQAEAA